MDNPCIEAKSDVEHPVIEDGKQHDSDQIYEKDIGAIDGILPVLGPNGTIGAE